jgi:hypothetical protein
LSAIDPGGSVPTPSLPLRRANAAPSNAAAIAPLLVRFDNAVAFGVGFCFPTLTYIAMAEMPPPFVGLTNVRLPASCLGRLCRSAFASIDILLRGQRSPVRYADVVCDFERDD